MEANRTMSQTVSFFLYKSELPRRGEADLSIRLGEFDIIEIVKRLTKNFTFVSLLVAWSTTLRVKP